MQLSMQSPDSVIEVSQAPSSEQAEFARIIVIATQQIGDVLLTTPLIRAARRRQPLVEAAWCSTMSSTNRPMRIR